MNYDELVAAVAAWPDLQGEPDLQAMIPTLIVLAEAAINNDASLRLREALTEISGADTTVTALPPDCLQVERVVDSEGVPLEFASTDNLAAPARGCSSGRVRYTIDGNRLRFEPQVGAYTLRYYQRPQALADAGTHWLIQKEPSLYLYGTLIQAAIFSKESDRETARYADAYAAAIDRLTADDWIARMPIGQAIRSL